MSNGTKVSDLARLTELTSTPHPTGSTELVGKEPLVRYTAEIPKHLHRNLKQFALDNDTSTYAVTKALLTLLQTDKEVEQKVVGVLNHA